MVLADVFKRWHTLKGRPAILCTGTDEHGMKVQRAAQKAGQPPKEFCDATAEKFREIAETLGLSDHDFIRTTDEHHVRAVQQFWRELRERGFIYETVHKGWYSVSDECFYPESMIHRSFVPETGKVIFSAVESGSEVEWVEEKTYHFRMTDFKEKLLDFYKANPEWIEPRHRMSEVISWVENHLENLSISRPASRLSWGIPVPDDPEQTIYVWVDALINYLTNAGYPTWAADAMRGGGWPADVHVIGKDIVRFHGVYWPALLLALDLPLPKRLLTHAHWTISGKKISKSAGNGVSPVFAADRFGADTVRFFLMRKGAIRDDSVFDNAEVAKAYRTELMGGYGNLLSRTMKTKRWSVVEAVKREAGAQSSEPCPIGLETLRDEVSREMNALRPDKALALIVGAQAEVCTHPHHFPHYDRANRVQGNKYMTRMEPWNIRDPNVDDPAALARLSTVIYTLSETLRITSILLQPYMPARAADALDRLGVRADRRTFEFAVRGADGEYGMSAARPEGKGSEGSLFPPLPSSEFESEEGEPLEEDKKARAKKRKGKGADGVKEKRKGRKDE